MMKKILFLVLIFFSLADCSEKIDGTLIITKHDVAGTCTILKRNCHNQKFTKYILNAPDLKKDCDLVIFAKINFNENFQFGPWRELLIRPNIYNVYIPINFLKNDDGSFKQSEDKVSILIQDSSGHEIMINLTIKEEHFLKEIYENWQMPLDNCVIL